MRAWRRHSSHTAAIAATLFFGDDGLLTNFVSDDRSRSSPDGKTFTRQRFSTPMRDYRSYGPARLAAYGEARWHPPEGEFTYGEFHLVDVSFNVRYSHVRVLMRPYVHLEARAHRRHLESTQRIIECLRSGVESRAIDRHAGMRQDRD